MKIWKSLNKSNVLFIVNNIQIDFVENETQRAPDNLKEMLQEQIDNIIEVKGVEKTPPGKTDITEVADDYLDQNVNTVISHLEKDDLSNGFLQILYKFEQKNKNRKKVIEKIKELME